MAGGGSDLKGEKGLLWHWPHGGDMEVSISDFKSPAHSLHHLPRLPTKVSGGSRHGYRHPRGQTALAVIGLEGRCSVHDIYGPEQ